MCSDKKEENKSDSSAQIVWRRTWNGCVLSFFLVGRVVVFSFDSFPLSLSSISLAQLSFACLQVQRIGREVCNFIGHWTESRIRRCSNSSNKKGREENGERCNKVDWSEENREKEEEEEGEEEEEQEQEEGEGKEEEEKEEEEKEEEGKEEEEKEEEEIYWICFLFLLVGRASSPVSPILHKNFRIKHPYSIVYAVNW